MKNKPVLAGYMFKDNANFINTIANHCIHLKIAYLPTDPTTPVFTVPDPQDKTKTLIANVGDVITFYQDGDYDITSVSAK